MTYDDLLALLRRRRMEINISQAELARRLGMSSAGMNQRESGQREPRSFEELQQWMGELGLTLAAVDKREAELLDRLHAMTDEQRAALAAFLEVILPKK